MKYKIAQWLLLKLEKSGKKKFKKKVFLRENQCYVVQDTSGPECVSALSARSALTESANSKSGKC